MSLLEQVGAGLTATADELPLATVGFAAEKLRVATDLLMWVRQESTNPLAVPQLTAATEHLEQAGHALRVGQDAVGEYLAAVGLGYAAPPEQPLGDQAGRRGASDHRPESGEAAQPPSLLGRWWTERVNQLARGPDTHAGTREEGGSAEADSKAASTSDELLRRVAARVRAGDREGLRRELAAVPAPVGLGVSALAPAISRRLATDLFGHPPGPSDAAELTKRTRDGFRRLVPHLPEEVVAVLLARVCRVHPGKPAPSPASSPGRRDRSDRAERLDRAERSDRPDPQGRPTHPADPAVAGAVLTGLLLHRLDREPESLEHIGDG